MRDIDTQKLDAYRAAHKAAQDADDAYSAALRAAYGAKAGDKRYRLHHDSAAVNDARTAFFRAMDARNVAYDAWRLSFSKL